MFAKIRLSDNEQKKAIYLLMINWFSLRNIYFYIYDIL